MSLRRFAVALLAVAAAALVPAAVRAGELYAYVGAGLRGPVDALIQDFTAETGVTVQAEYGGSGQLLTRFKETGRGDVFIPGSTFFTDKLAADGATAYVRTLVVHGPVLAVNPARAATVTGFADLAKPGVRVGLGDPQAMALGRTAEQILDKSGMGDVIRANVTARGATVKQLALYVLDGQVDAAIIGASDAAQNPGKLVILPIPAEWFQPEYAPAAALTTSIAPDDARRFVDYLASAKGLAVFQRFGFPPAPQP